jgi:hypothetical protein
VKVGPIGNTALAPVTGKPLIVVFISLNSLVLVNACLHDPFVGYDVGEHLKYVETLGKMQLPTAAETAEFYLFLRVARMFFYGLDGGKFLLQLDPAFGHTKEAGELAAALCTRAAGIVHGAAMAKEVGDGADLASLEQWRDKPGIPE